MRDEYKKVLDKFKSLPEVMQWYFTDFESLVNNRYAWDILIAYLFMKVEQAQRMTLYAAMVKKYRVNSISASKALDDLHMSRSKFREVYETLAGRPINKKILKKGKKAEAVRDDIMHGKSLVHGRGISLGEKVGESEKRDAVICVLQYAILFNEQTDKDFGFTPFGKMQGFNGRGKSHNEITSEWMLKGMGVVPLNPKDAKNKTAKDDENEDE